MAVMPALFASKDEDELIRIAKTEKEPLLRQRARMQLAAAGARPRRSSSSKTTRTRRLTSRPYDIVGRMSVTTGDESNPLLDGLRIEPTPAPTALVIFGASGDLTRRKLLPAVYQLSRGQRLPARFNVLGVARSPMTDDQFRAAVPRQPEGIRRRGQARRSLVGAGARRSDYVQGEMDDPGALREDRGQAGRDALPGRRALLPRDPAVGLRHRRRAAERRRA